ncbi:DUF2169 domain-containing protein [Vibrio sp. SCSIO 43153]|uniref:DUF2169 family type VI secretion system accessory protein n=1 Tax=Vibrio sp. SCSIO 43153 TaxID=2819098 RepID=UPI00207625D3|nr:DUF2169 domain-containing protein [Vibrio sp. SCSIO 43153]USD49180.1 DUF2169 domain-containing protein [Vibrio sp. SCSIO 43153]
MELHNSSKLDASYASSLSPDGSNGLVIVAKGSWSFPKGDQNAKLLKREESLAIQETDTFTGDPGVSSPIYENDFASFKPYCDVIMHAHAHSIMECGEERVRVRLKLNQIDKQFSVTGARAWISIGLGTKLNTPQLFNTQPINYDIAFGGTDSSRLSDGKIKVCMANPIGLGYLPLHSDKDRKGKAGPQTEEIGEPIRSSSHLYKPQSFGPIARNWLPRLQYGGTYDQNWIDNVRPFLPDDFDERFYQCAPSDQQTDYLKGGEKVILEGVHPTGIISFEIPQPVIYMAVIDAQNKEHILQPVADTLIIEPELERFSIVWRANWKLCRTAEEVDTILVGTPTKAWRRAKMLGKTYMLDKGKLLR